MFVSSSEDATLNTCDGGFNSLWFIDFYLTPSENSSQPSTSLQVSSSAKLSLILASSPAWLNFTLSYFLFSGQYQDMFLDFPQLYQSPLNLPVLPLVVRATPSLDLYCCDRGLAPPFRLTSIQCGRQCLGQTVLAFYVDVVHIYFQLSISYFI